MADKTYISREAVLDVAFQTLPLVGTSPAEAMGISRMSAAVYRALRNIPAADVVPVRHGTNIGEDYADCDQFICSNCGIELQDWVRVERNLDDGEITHHEYTFRYCPNCGAKMTR